jgi:DNA-binding SARP family transcriptional activator
MLARLERPRPVRPVLAAYCLGEFRLELDGVETNEWRSGRALRLFQYLITHRRGPAAPDTLVDALWSDPQAADPGTSLRVSVHLLRQELARHASALGRISIKFGDGGYRLIAPELWLDVDEFETHVASGRHLEAFGDGSAALAAYARAAELYQGEFLTGAWQQWAILRRERLKDQFLFVAGRLADAALHVGDFETAIVHCQSLLQADPYHEPSYRKLMQSHARLGQLGRVRRWYEVCAHTLRADLGLAPQPETDLVYRSVLGQHQPALVRQGVVS